jgi:predicted aconitase with swiveling domain
VLHGEFLAPGAAEGQVNLLSEPLSLWGGFDLENGQVSDVNHPQHGTPISGRVLVMPGGRGSSSSSSILLESARLGTHPLAIIIAERDPILVVGALVAADLYGVKIPVVRLPRENLREFKDMKAVRIIAEAGNARITPI